MSVSDSSGTAGDTTHPSSAYAQDHQSPDVPLPIPIPADQFLSPDAALSHRGSTSPNSRNSTADLLPTSPYSKYSANTPGSTKSAHLSTASISNSEGGFSPRSAGAGSVVTDSYSDDSTAKQDSKCMKFLKCRFRWTLRLKSLIFLLFACGVLLTLVLCVMYFVTLPAFISVEKSDSKLDSQRMADILSTNYFSLYQGLLTNSVWDDPYNAILNDWPSDPAAASSFFSGTYGLSFMLNGGIDFTASYGLDYVMYGSSGLDIARTTQSAMTPSILPTSTVQLMLQQSNETQTATGGFFVSSDSIWFVMATVMLKTDGSGPPAGLLVYASRILPSNLKQFATLMTRCVSLYPTIPASDAPSWLRSAASSLDPASVVQPIAGKKLWNHVFPDVYSIVHIDGASVPGNVRQCHSTSQQDVSASSARVLTTTEVSTFDGTSKIVFAIDNERSSYDIGVQTLIILSASIGGSILVISFLAFFGIDFLVVRPIKQLNEDVLRIRSGEDLEKPIAIGSSNKKCCRRFRTQDEVGMLSVSFNQMRRVLVMSRKQDMLLANVIPLPIAKRMMRGEAFIADEYRHATVLFTDIVQFTEMSAILEPRVLVSLLNGLVSTFDRIAAKYGVEKIKTIGDAYFAVSGVPELKPPEEQAEAVFLATMEILTMLHDWATFCPPAWLPPGVRLRIRAGAAIGPVVAGVLGTSKKVWDIWGDTVNSASRMESHGKPGCLQITEDLYQCLPADIRNDRDHYRWLPPAEVQVKGKGRMVTRIVAPRFPDDDILPPPPLRQSSSKLFTREKDQGSAV
eukprot:ANDGO_07341.mRNA.1 Adenylate cyclase